MHKANGFNLIPNNVHVLTLLMLAYLPWLNTPNSYIKKKNRQNSLFLIIKSRQFVVFPAMSFKIAYIANRFFQGDNFSLCSVPVICRC